MPALFLIIMILLMPVILGVSCGCTGCAMVFNKVVEDQQNDTRIEDSKRIWENEEMDYKRMLIKKASGEEMYDNELLKIELWPLRGKITKEEVDKVKKEWDAAEAIVSASRGDVSAKTGGWMDEKWHAKKAAADKLRQKHWLLNHWQGTKEFMQKEGSWEDPE
jgi:hypothetical protein